MQENDNHTIKIMSCIAGHPGFSIGTKHKHNKDPSNEHFLHIWNEMNTVSKIWYPFLLTDYPVQKIYDLIFVLTTVSLLHNI